MLINAASRNLSAFSSYSQRQRHGERATPAWIVSVSVIPQPKHVRFARNPSVRMFSCSRLSSHATLLRVEYFNFARSFIGYPILTHSPFTPRKYMSFHTFSHATSFRDGFQEFLQFLEITVHCVRAVVRIVRLCVRTR